MSDRKLVIVGAGGFGREVAWAAREAVDPWHVAGFLDDDETLHGSDLCGAAVLGPITRWNDYADAAFVIALGPPRVRRRVTRRMEADGAPRWGTIVHRSVASSRFVKVGAGSIICAGVAITTEVSLGAHTIVNLNCTIGHDVIMGDWCTLAPLIACSGNVTLGNGVEIGTGAAVRQGVTLKDGAMLGMGSVLTKDVPCDSLWLGSPAQERRKLPAWDEVAT